MSSRRNYAGEDGTASDHWAWGALLAVLIGVYMAFWLALWLFPDPPSEPVETTPAVQAVGNDGGA